MHAILIAAALAAAPAEAECQSATTAAREISTYAETGTLIFSEGDCLAVRMFTRSPYTHVAAIVVEDNKPYVYDSMNGVGVRRQTLKDYCDSECPNTLHVYRPRNSFSKRRSELFVNHLKSELGRPYGVKHHVTGKRAKGIHCAEYMMDAFSACKLMEAKRPSKVSPDSLREGVEQARLYDNVLVLDVSDPEPENTANRWYERWWFETKTCSTKGYRKMKGWFACK